MKQYNIGLVIGRFQPLHKGHVYLIKKALVVCEKIIIGIGSSNVQDSNNPFEVKERKKMVEELIRSEKLDGWVIKIIEIPDVPDDDVWFEMIKNQAGEIDAVIGNNDWVSRIFKSHHIPVIAVEYFNRRLLEGYKIRRLMEKNKSWENRVPKYVNHLISKRGV